MSCGCRSRAVRWGDALSRRLPPGVQDHVRARVRALVNIDRRPVRAVLYAFVTWWAYR